MTKASIHHAEQMVRSIGGARVTRPRVAVLALLLSARRALTHHEVEQQVNRAFRIDRVTIYRVLEWLTACGLAHRVPGDDRVWRFNAGEQRHAPRHAHFKCNDCGEVICLDSVAAPRGIALPSGYRSQEIELTVKGLCADCVPMRTGQRSLRGYLQHRH